MSKKILSSILLFSILLSLTPVYADVDDNVTDLQSLRTRISDVQGTSLGLPGGVAEPKGKIGFIISKMFNSSGQVSNSVLKAFSGSTRVNNNVLKWTGGVGGSFDQSLIYDDGVTVGIGTTADTPSLKLDVSGSVGATQYCDGSGNNCFDPASVALDGDIVGGGGSPNYVARFTGTGYTLGDGIIQDNGTNVGIGVAPSGDRLRVNGVARLDGGVTVDGRAAISGTNATHTARNTTNGNYGYFEVRRNDNIRGAYFGWGNGGSIVDITVDTANQLRINGGANGTTLLQVDGGAVIDTGDTNTDFTVTDTDKGTVSEAIWYDYSTGRVYVGNTGASGTNPEFTIRGQAQLDEEGTLATHLVTKGYVDTAVAAGGLWNQNGLKIYYNNGNVGIGTNDALEKLDVRGSIMATGVLKSRGPNYTSTWMAFDEDQFGNSLILGAGGLTAIGSGESSGQIRANIGASQETLYLSSDGGVNIVTNLQSGWASRVDAVTIGANGNVGIGTTGLTGRLNVNGTRSNTVNYANSIANIGGSDIRLSLGAYNGSPNWGTWLQSLRTSDSASFNLALNPNGGGVSIGTGAISPGLSLDVEGNVGAIQYCDNLGGNCVPAASLIGGATLWTLADTNEITSATGNDVDIEGFAAVGPAAGNAEDYIALRIGDNDFNGNTDRTVYQTYVNQTIPTTSMTGNRTSYGHYLYLTNNKGGSSTNGTRSYANGYYGLVRNTGTNYSYNNRAGAFYARNESTAGSYNQTGIYAEARQNDTTGSSNVAYLYGLDTAAYGETNVSGNSTATNVRAINANINAYETDITTADGVLVTTKTQNGDTGRITTAYGVRGYVYSDSDDGGSITNGRAGYFYSYGRATAPTMSSSIGLYAQASDGITSTAGQFIATGTRATTNYGVYIDARNASTNNYAIYAPYGRVYFNDNVGISAVTPDDRLHVNGTVQVGPDTATNGSMKLFRHTDDRFIMAPYDDGTWQWGREFGYSSTANNWYFDTNVTSPNPTAANHLTTKSYVDGLLSTAADNLGNHIATQDIITTNIGEGMTGVYSPTRYQHVWGMGSAYNLPANGLDESGAAGNFYGLAWSYNPNHSYAGSNPQAKPGLNHQLLLMMNGITYTALGNGIWTSGNVTINGSDLDFVRGDSSEIRSLGRMSFDWTGGTYDDSTYHGIESKNESGTFADSLRINSYSDIINTIDSNSNSTSRFIVQRQSQGNGEDLFTVDESGNAYFKGVVTGVTPTATAHLATKGYVDTALASGAGGYWSKSGTNVYYNGGNIGIGLNNPATSLDVNGTVRVRGDSANIQFNDINNNNYLMHVNSNRLYFMHDANNNMTWDDGNDDRIVMYSPGNGLRLGIGTNDPSYPLHVVGDALMNGWVRTSGATGWYSQTYGGGWYMTDTTWIRNYNSKNVYINTQLRADGGLFFNTTNRLDDVTGNYGSVQINGGGASGWEGYSIDGRVAFVHNGSTASGLYNDVNNERLFYAINNGETRMYHNGVWRIRTHASGIQLNGATMIDNVSCIGNCF